MCMVFDCNPQFNCRHFLCNLHLVIFGLKHLDTVHLVNATPPFERSHVWNDSI